MVCPSIFLPSLVPSLRGGVGWRRDCDGGMPMPNWARPARNASRRQIWRAATAHRIAAAGDQMGLFWTLYSGRGPWTAPPISGAGVRCRSWVNTPQQRLDRGSVAGYLAWPIWQFVSLYVEKLNKWSSMTASSEKKEPCVLCTVWSAHDGRRDTGYGTTRCGRPLAAVPADSRGMRLLFRLEDSMKYGYRRESRIRGCRIRHQLDPRSCVSHILRRRQ